MKNQILSLFIFLVVALPALAQNYVVNQPTSDLQILGTSTLHDWEIDAEEFSGNASISDENGITINRLSFDVKVKKLKSEYSAMDKNTWKALKADDHPTIHYRLTKVLDVNGSDGTYNIRTRGNLTIAGKSREVEMTVLTAKVGSKIKFAGDVSFPMSDFNVDPPTAMLGTIKTGDEVTVRYNIEYKQ